VRITTGTANEQSVGGNGIPIGCFSAVFSIKNIPYLAKTFACYSDTEHNFEPLVQGADATLSCHAKEM
jgi:hypothetical protein